MADVTQTDVYNLLAAMKDVRHDIIDSTGTGVDRIEAGVVSSTNTIKDQLFQIGRESADNRAQILALSYQTRDGFAAAAKDAEINALKNQVESQKNKTEILTAMKLEGDSTRALINSIREGDQNRMLIERNTELVGALEHGRHWRGRYYDGQFQGLASSMQNFQSQLAETRQGLVNFGTMTGAAGQQTSTSNNVR